MKERTKRICIAVLIITAILLLFSGCSAKAFKSKRFWVEASVVAAAAVTDGVTTQQYLRRCATCYETNPLLGRRPSATRIYLTGAAIHGLKKLAIAAIWQRNERAGRRLSTADAVVSGLFHGVYAVHNTRLCPSGGCK